MSDAIQTTMKREDIIAIVREVAGSVRADLVKECQEKALEAIDSKMKSAEPTSRKYFGGRASQYEDVESFTKTVGGIDLEVKQVSSERAKMDPFYRPTVAKADGDVEFMPYGMAPRIIRCIALARAMGMSYGQAKQVAADLGFKVTAKALDTTVLADGGALIAPEFSNEIIEALRPFTVVRAAGPMVTPLRGTRTQPFVNVGSTAAYTGENVSVRANQPTTGAVVLSEKKLYNIVPVSDEMLRTGGAQVEQVIMRDLARGLAVREDAAFLRGDGTQYVPKGMTTWAQNSFNSSGSSIAQITTDAARAPRELEDDNVQISRGHWFSSPRTFWYLRALRTANSEYAFPEIQQGLFLGFPISRTQQIPSNLGGGSDSQLILANMDDLEIGQAQSTLIEAFPGGTYVDASGNLVSGISAGQTVIKGTEAHDFMARMRGLEICVINQVSY